MNDSNYRYELGAEFHLYIEMRYRGEFDLRYLYFYTIKVEKK